MTKSLDENFACVALVSRSRQLIHRETRGVAICAEKTAFAAARAFVVGNVELVAF
jgi:hypothetical protein